MNLELMEVLLKCGSIWETTYHYINFVGGGVGFFFFLISERKHFTYTVTHNKSTFVVYQFPYFQGK